MSSRILVNSNLAAGKQVLEAVDAILEALAKARRIKAQMDSMSSGLDWTQVQTETGVASLAEAQDLWTIVSNATTQLDSPQVAELHRIDQG